MRQVELHGSPITTTVLGFGCGSITFLGATSSARRVLDKAFDSGFRHFDVARSYGYGTAESVLGAFARQRRDQITITTKVGITPPTISRLAALKAVGRPLLHRLPHVHSVLRNRTDSLISYGEFSLENVRQSFEVSLRELQTDYVDLLLLHECRPADIDNDELLSFLENRRQNGSVRRYGIATGARDSVQILENHPAYARVVQTDIAGFRKRFAGNPQFADSPFLTHSLLGTRLRRLRDAVRTREWEDVGVDPDEEGVLVQLLIANAVGSNEDGVTLISTQRSDRIDMAVEALTRFSAPQLQSFDLLMTKVDAQDSDRRIA